MTMYRTSFPKLSLLNALIYFNQWKDMYILGKQSFYVYIPNKYQGSQMNINVCININFKVDNFK